MNKIKTKETKKLKVKERRNVQHYIDTSNTDEVSAFLTTSLVSHTYEVETTKSVVTTWDNLRKNLKLTNNLDYIAALLATGRIMDYGFEIRDPNILNTIITDINKDIVSRKIKSSDLQKELITALITSASISRSEKVESIREIVNLWTIVKEKLDLKGDLDYIAGILSIGRIMELKITSKGFQEINDIFVSIKDELKNRAADLPIGQREVAAAFITSAYVEISPKVEKIRDIVDTWMKVCVQISIESQWDYITMILSTGRIKDMNAKHILGPDNLKDLNIKVRTQLKKVVGE